MNTSARVLPTVLILTLTSALGLVGYLYYKTSQRLSESASAIEAGSKEHSLTIEALQKTIADRDGVVATLQSETEALREKLASTTSETERIKEAQRIEHEQIGQFVTEVQKIQSIDPDLLKKYSKNYFLNENYKPSSLSTIPTNWQTSKKDPIEYLAPAIPFMTKMLESAQSDGINIRVVSGFRSFEDQKGLKSAYKSTFGVGANKFSADQGYSEHQLGTAADFSTKELDTNFSNFAGSKGYQWMNDNAYKYGFILSYPKGNAYYMYEPWHWRFVGVTLATEIHNRNIHFYDMEQRDIDKYLGQLFDAN